MKNRTEHNTIQRNYFESNAKPRMRPGFTPYICRQADRLIDVADLKPGNDVLEVGCGMGRHTFYLAKRGLHITALDLSAKLLEALKYFDGGHYNIRTHCGDILDVQWRNTDS